MSKKRGVRVGRPAGGSRRVRASHEDVLAANGVIAVNLMMVARVNRIRTDPRFLFQWHLSRARGT